MTHGTTRAGARAVYAVEAAQQQTRRASEPALLGRRARRGGAAGRPLVQVAWGAGSSYRGGVDLARPWSWRPVPVRLAPDTPEAIARGRDRSRDVVGIHETAPARGPPGPVGRRRECDLAVAEMQPVRGFAWSCTARVGLKRWATSVRWSWARGSSSSSWITGWSRARGQDSLGCIPAPFPVGREGPWFGLGPPTPRRGNAPPTRRVEPHRRRHVGRAEAESSILAADCASRAAGCQRGADSERAVKDSPTAVSPAAAAPGSRVAADSARRRRASPRRPRRASTGRGEPRGSGPSGSPSPRQPPGARRASGRRARRRGWP